MVTLETLQNEIYRGSRQVYQCDRAINLYSSPNCHGLVTQANIGHHINILEIAKNQSAIRVCVCKDDYLGWMAAAHASDLALVLEPYRAPVLTPYDIQSRLPQVLEFATAAMAIPNQYLWGGTVAPDYDCSGLVQSAFASAGVQLPRDSYQQEDFTQHISLSDLQPGDLIFFGTPARTTHVALYISEGRYIHSSGTGNGRNGIGIDSLTNLSDPVSASYRALLRCYGRVTSSYQPGGLR